MKNQLPLAVLAVLACGVSSQALAQSGVDPDGASSVDDAPQTEENSVTGEIIVTATRREASLQEVPISITAVTSEQLESAGIASSRELTKMVPNLTVTNTAGSFNPSIRGVGSTTTSVGSEGGVAVHIDGVYIPDLNNTFQDMLEIERVEVLRGPQGTLFGRNSTGGTLNIITKTPSFDTSGNVRVRYGRFNSLRLGGYVTTGVADTVAIDFSGSYSRGDGWIRDLVNGGTANPSETYAFRSKVLLQPTENFRLTASITREASDDPTAVTFFVVDRNTVARRTDPNVLIADGPYDTATEVDRRLFSNAWRGDIQSHLELGGVNLETTSSYARTKSGFVSDIDNTPLATQVALTGEGYGAETFTNELRLFSDSKGKFDWIFGAYYFYTRAEGETRRINAVNGAVLASTIPLIRTLSLAGFGEITFRPTDSLVLTAGARYTWEKIKFRQISRGALLFNTETSNEKITPKLSAQYFLAPKTNIYATFSTGFKGGTYSPNSTSSVPVLPENITAYEVGIHSDPLPNLRVNASVFHYDYKDLQVSSRLPNQGFLLQNAADSRVKGGELEIGYEPIDGLVLRAAVAYADAKYRTFLEAQNFVPTVVNGVAVGGNTQVAIDASGNQLPRAPKTSYFLGANYSRDIGNGEIGGSVDVFHSSRVYWDSANLNFQPSYTTVSAEVFWSPTEALRLSVWGTNLTNEIVARQISVPANGTFQVNEPPRQYGVAARFAF